MIKFDTYFCSVGEFNSPSVFFVDACLQLPKGSYTAYQYNTNTTKALTK